MASMIPSTPARQAILDRIREEVADATERALLELRRLPRGPEELAAVERVNRLILERQASA